MTYTVIGVYEDNLQGGCFHVEANSSPYQVRGAGIGGKRCLSTLPPLLLDNR